MDFIICVGRASRYIEEKYFRRFRGRRSDICGSREFLSELKKKFGGEDEELVKVGKLKRIEEVIGERVKKRNK